MAAPAGLGMTPGMPVLPPGQYVLLVLQFVEQLNRGKAFTIEEWQQFVAVHFEPHAVYKLTVWNTKMEDLKSFEMDSSILPRYFHVMFGAALREQLLFLKRPREVYNMQSCSVAVECLQAIQVSVYTSAQVHSLGPLRVVMSPEQKILQWEFITQQHYELIPRPLMSRVVRRTIEQVLKNPPEVVEGKRCDSAPHMIPSPVNDFGVPSPVMRCLEIAEVVRHMSDVIKTSLEHNMGPLESLIKIKKQQQESNCTGERDNVEARTPLHRAHGLTPMEGMAHEDPNDNTHPTAME